MSYGVLQVQHFLNSRKPQQEGGWKLPKVDHASGFLRYSQADASSHAHEAGWVLPYQPYVPCTQCQMHNSNASPSGV